MAGTMPHAVFVETDADGTGAAAAYSAELPGCAAFAATAEEAVAAMPARANEFVEWLNGHGESLRSFAGGSWYEVERAAAVAKDGVRRRAAFSLDELPPSDAEFARYLHWAELAREELAEALDRADAATAEPWLRAIADQDGAFAGDLGKSARGDEAQGDAAPDEGDPLDRFFAARDRLIAALEAAGPTEAVRRVLRVAIADDLRAAEQLRAAAPR